MDDGDGVDTSCHSINLNGTQRFCRAVRIKRYCIARRDRPTGQSRAHEPKPNPMPSFWCRMDDDGGPWMASNIRQFETTINENNLPRRNSIHAHFGVISFAKGYALRYFSPTHTLIEALLLFSLRKLLMPPRPIRCWIHFCCLFRCGDLAFLLLRKCVRT